MPESRRSRLALAVVMAASAALPAGCLRARADVLSPAAIALLSPSIREIVPLTAPPGGGVTIRGSGFPADRTLDVGMGVPGSPFQVLVQTRSNALGEVHAVVQVPAWAEPGRGHVFVLVSGGGVPPAVSDLFWVAAPVGGSRFPGGGDR